jgi:hypothetical protein
MQRSPGSIARNLRTPNPEGMRDRPARAWWLMPRLIFVARLAALAVSPAFLPSA